MIVLKKTTTIPDEDPKNILSKKMIKMVVLIDDKATAEHADDAAHDPLVKEVDYWVFWFRKPDFNQIRKMIPGLPSDLGNVIYFTLSTNNTIVDIVRKGDNYNEMTFRKHFVRAGKPEFNNLS